MSISNDLFILADSFNLDLSLPTSSVLTRYSNTMGKSNSVINLMFLCSRSNELNNHSIHPDQCPILDYVPLTVTIPIEEKFVQSSKLFLLKKSKKEELFVTEVINIFKSLDTSILSNLESLKQVVNSLVSRINQAQNINARKVNITKYSKKWWNENCN